MAPSAQIKLQVLMHRAGLTDWAVAKATGFSIRPNVVQYARTKARNPGWETVEAITRGFNAAFLAKHGIDPYLTETQIFGGGPLPDLPGIALPKGAAA